MYALTHAAVTTHQYHAQEVVLGANLASYEGIATVGGDGMLSEVRIPDILGPL